MSTRSRFHRTLALLLPIVVALAACESATAPQAEEYEYAPPASRQNYNAIAMGEAMAGVAGEVLTRLGLLWEARTRGEVDQALAGFRFDEGFGKWILRCEEGRIGSQSWTCLADDPLSGSGNDPEDWRSERISFRREGERVADPAVADEFTVTVERHRRDVGRILGPPNVSDGEIRRINVRFTLTGAWPPQTGSALGVSMGGHSTHHLQRTTDLFDGHAWRVEQRLSFSTEAEGRLPDIGSCIELQAKGSLFGAIYEGQYVDLGWYGYEIPTSSTRHELEIELDPAVHWAARSIRGVIGEGTTEAPSYFACDG